MRSGRSALARRTSVVLVVGLVLFALGFIGSEPGVGSGSPISGAATSRLGFYPGYAGLANLRGLEDWLGHPASYVVQFADTREEAFTSSVWGEVAKAGELQTIAKQITLVESIPLAFGGSIDANTSAGRAIARANLQATAAGAHDGEYRVAANYLRNGGYADAIIRLGWEFDGDWYPWSSRGNEALWIAAYRHVADVFRSVSSGFRFDWNGTAGFLQRATAAYPGDGYVDVVGLDVYDKGLPTIWDPTTKGWEDPAAAFDSILADLRAQRDFAIAHGKPVSYPEWALTGVDGTTKSRVGGDDPFFVQGMSNWMTGLPATGPGSLSYQSYFNEDTSDGHHRIDARYFPRSEKLYRTLFGSTLELVARSDPATTVWGQQVVLRSQAASPNGAPSALGGNVIFLDGLRVLGAAPVRGGGASFATKSLAPGGHSIRALYFPNAGLAPVVSAPLAQHVGRRWATLQAPSVSVAPGARVAVIARVTPTGQGLAAPAGVVVFTNVATHATSRATLRAGVARLVLPAPGLGTHAFTARYLGSGRFLPATVQLTVKVRAYK